MIYGLWVSSLMLLWVLCDLVLCFACLVFGRCVLVFVAFGLCGIWFVLLFGWCLCLLRYLRYIALVYCLVLVCCVLRVLFGFVIVCFCAWFVGENHVCLFVVSLFVSAVCFFVGVVLLVCLILLFRFYVLLVVFVCFVLFCVFVCVGLG